MENNFDLKCVVAINKTDLADKVALKKLKKILADYCPLEMSAKDSKDCERIFTKIFSQR